jgi:hypothetical protein
MRKCLLPAQLGINIFINLLHFSVKHMWIYYFIMCTHTVSSVDVYSNLQIICSPKKTEKPPLLTSYIYLPINCKLIQKFKDCYCAYRYYTLYTVRYSTGIVPGFSWILCHFVQLFKIGHYVFLSLSLYNALLLAA